MWVLHVCFHLSQCCCKCWRCRKRWCRVTGGQGRSRSWSCSWGSGRGNCRGLGHGLSCMEMHKLSALFCTQICIQDYINRWNASKYPRKAPKTGQSFMVVSTQVAVDSLWIFFSKIEKLRVPSAWKSEHNGIDFKIEGGSHRFVLDWILQSPWAYLKDFEPKDQAFSPKPYVKDDNEYQPPSINTSSCKTTHDAETSCMCASA